MSASKLADVFAGTWDLPKYGWLEMLFSSSLFSYGAGVTFLEAKHRRLVRDPEVSEDVVGRQRRYPVPSSVSV